MVSGGSQRAPYVAALGATVVSGLFTYAFLAFVSRSSTAEAFDDFSVFWSLSLLIGFGLFVPLEQELARSREDGRTAVHETFAIGAAMAVLAAVAVIVAGALGLLELGPGLMLATVVMVLLSPLQYTAKGRLVQHERIVAHAAATVIENLVRTGIAAVLFGLALAGGRSTDPLPSAFAVVIALVLAYAWALGPDLKPSRLIMTRVRRRARVILAILVPSLVGQALVNAGPLVIDAMSDAPGVTGAFQATFNLARLPLFVVLPLQAVLIGRMAADIAQGRSRQLTSLLTLVGVGTAATALLGAGAALALGPWAVELLFGANRSLEAGQIALLVAAVCVYVGLVINTQALIVTGRTWWAAGAWVVAFASAVVAFTLLLPGLGVVTSVALALLVGSAIAWALSVAQIRWRTVHPDS